METHQRLRGKVKKGPPVAHTAAELSRLHDQLERIEDEEQRRLAWEALPIVMRLEYRWCVWEYVPERPTLRVVPPPGGTKC